ncbi:MAG TPA: orotidine 5'-phosphate decarboxylase [Nitrosopumilaceae archaeon]|nr:orotidine 5'-phosphate decarboxylase [Nitrosopumilaceae archaeon]
MATFKTRINNIANIKGKVILANDYSNSTKNIEAKTIKNIKTLNKFLCAIKFNFHLLLPLGAEQIIRINKLSHKYSLQTIADIKLNDIGNTNQITIENLWKLGFDAVIVNPIMGSNALKKLVSLAHEKNKGIIALCHMSAPEARHSYDMKVQINNSKKQIPLYQLFLQTSLLTKVDGIIVGATYPKIIKYCNKLSENKLNIYSPGIGTQGGKINQVLHAGTNFIIVGRTIINAKNPSRQAEEFQKLTIYK